MATIIRANLAEPAAGGTLGKSGIETLTLSGANNFSAVFTLSAGILTARNSLAFAMTAGGTSLAEAIVDAREKGCHPLEY